MHLGPRLPEHIPEKAQTQNVHYPAERPGQHLCYVQKQKSQSRREEERMTRFPSEREKAGKEEVQNTWKHNRKLNSTWRMRKPSTLWGGSQGKTLHAHRSSSRKAGKKCDPVRSSLSVIRATSGFSQCLRNHHQNQNHKGIL